MQMPSQHSYDPMRALMWSLALVAAIASACALYLGFRLREARSQAAISVAELAAKERQLSEYRDEPKRSRSALTSVDAVASAALPKLPGITPGESSTSPFPTGLQVGRMVLRGPAFHDMMRQTNLQHYGPSTTHY